MSLIQTFLLKCFQSLFQKIILFKTIITPSCVWNHMFNRETLKYNALKGLKLGSPYETLVEPFEQDFSLVSYGGTLV